MRIAGLAVGLVLLSALPALAYTQDDANACTNDVMRLCSQAIPDQARITQCLYKNRNRVSPACYAVYKRYSNGKQPSYTAQYR
jgi:hypothetical protein